MALRPMKIEVHLILAMIAAIIGFVTWKITARDIPSYFIAAWLHERHIHAGDYITPHFIFIRWKSCQKRIEPSIFDASGQRYIISGVERQSLPLGEDNFTLEPELIPSFISSGPAVYVARFIWKCSPIDWLYPIIYDVRIPFNIERE